VRQAAVARVTASIDALGAIAGDDLVFDPSEPQVVAIVRRIGYDAEAIVSAFDRLELIGAGAGEGALGDRLEAFRARVVDTAGDTEQRSSKTLAGARSAEVDGSIRFAGPEGA
jgi:hypothetical protein